MKRFKIGLAVLAALITMSFTITSRTGLLSGTYSVEGITCYNVLTISGTNWDADNAIQVPSQTSLGEKTIVFTSVDVDLDPTATEKLASLQSSVTGSTRVRTCTNEDVTKVCCYTLSSGVPVTFATGIASTFF